MKRTLTLLFGVILFLVSGVIVAQDVEKLGVYDKKGKLKKEYISATYHRPGITILFADQQTHRYSKYLSNTLKDEIRVMDKFDNNNLKPEKVHFNQGEANYQIPLKAREVISLLYGRNEKGLFTQEIINKRSNYAATDAEAEVANMTQDKSSLQTIKGEELLNSVYILVITPAEIITMTEYYNREDDKRREQAKKAKQKFEPIPREKGGYTGSFDFKMYHLNMADTNLLYWRDSIYVDNTMTNEEQVLKVKKWESYRPVVEEVMSGSVGGSGTYSLELKKNQIPSDQELFEQMVDGVVWGSQLNVSDNYKPFRVKAKVIAENPIGAKVGKKESVNLDARFFVYEQRQDKENRKYSHRVGVVRSYWIADNRFDVTDTANKFKCDTSLFYQTAGGRVRNGMFMEHKPDAGLSFSLGYNVGNLGGLGFRLEYNLPGLSRTKGSKLEILKGYKVGFDFNLITKKDLKITEEAKKILPILQDGDYTFFRIMFDNSIEWVIARNFTLAPIVGVGAEFAFEGKEKNEADKWSYGALMANVGGRGGMNLTHNIQLQAAIKYHLIFGKTIAMPPKDSSSESEWIDLKWDEIFEGRKGITFNLGFRYSF